MMQQGKVSFRTCFRTALIPYKHLISLATAVYPSEQGMSFDIAFHHWFLIECLSAVGGHSIL